MIFLFRDYIIVFCFENLVVFIYFFLFKKMVICKSGRDLKWDKIGLGF